LHSIRACPSVIKTDDGWYATAKPVNEVEFIFAGGVYAENRRCTRLPDNPKPGEPFVIGYGPKLLAAEGRSAPNTLCELSPPMPPVFPKATPKVPVKGFWKSVVLILKASAANPVTDAKSAISQL